MQSKDLEIFNEMPFLFWVKDEEGRYLWGNRTISEFAKEDIAGKTDAELMWSDNAEALKAADKKVLDTGEPLFLREYVGNSGKGKSTLNVCKFVGEFEGKKMHVWNFLCYRIVVHVPNQLTHQ